MVVYRDMFTREIRPAYIACPHCGKQTKEQRRDCIHCGEPIHKVPQKEEENESQ